MQDWPSNEKPRERLLKHGSECLSDAELLSIIFIQGMQRKPVVFLSKELLSHFGSLSAVFEASREEFCAIKGLGLSKYCQCQAIAALCKRYLTESLTEGKRKVSIEDPKEVKKFFYAHLADQKQEIFACLFLDKKHRVIRFEKLFYGTIDATQVYPRIMIQKCLHYNAAAVIVAHNHPSGCVHPSHADKVVTACLGESLKIIDVSLLDHIVVSKSAVVSFSELGLLA